jgi:hypothetical protein
MSDDLKVPGFQACTAVPSSNLAHSSPGLRAHRQYCGRIRFLVRRRQSRSIKEGTPAYSAITRNLTLQQTNGIFQLQVKNAEGKEENWTIDLKKTGTVYKGPAKPKADVTIILSDETLMDLASGKV